MKYTKFLFILSLQVLTSKIENNKAVTNNKPKKKKEIAQIAQSTPKKQEKSEMSEYEQWKALVNFLEIYLPETVEDFKKKSLDNSKEKSLGHNELANRFSGAEITSLKEVFSKMENKDLKELLLSEIDSFEKSKNNNINNFIKLKFLYKMANSQVMAHEIAVTSIKENDNLNQALNRTTENSVKRLETIISKIEKIQKNKTRIPNRLKKTIKITKTYLKENNKNYTRILPHLVFYIAELETELKYVHVTNYIQTLK